jgi:hypothetical protein
MTCTRHTSVFFCMCCRHHVIEIEYKKKANERTRECGQPNAEYIRRARERQQHTYTDTQHT